MDRVDKVENTSRREFLKTAGKAGVVLGTIGATNLALNVAKAYAQSQFQDDINKLKGNNNPTYSVNRPTPNPSNYVGMSWDQIKEQLDTPEKVLDYIVTIRYQSEPRGIANHTQKPEETVRKGTGDCEDYAFVAKDALEYHSYKAKVLSVESKLSNGNILGHSVVIYKDKETKKWRYIQGYNFAGLTEGISEEFISLDSMARDIARKMNGTYYTHLEQTPREFINKFDKR